MHERKGSWCVFVCACVEKRGVRNRETKVEQGVKGRERKRDRMFACAYVCMKKKEATHSLVLQCVYRLRDIQFTIICNGYFLFVK